MRRSRPHDRPIAPPADWEELLAHLERGTILVAGTPAAGKTALAGYVAGQLDRVLERVASIDADPGQASVGPPACLGLALTGPWRSPEALWFAGDTEAGRVPLPVVVGAARLADRARRAGAEVVVIDAPAAAFGTVDLLWHLAVATGVDQVIAVGSELPHDLAGRLRRHATKGFHTLEARPARATRPAGDPPAGGAARHRALEERLAAHLAGARTRRLPAERLGVSPADEGTLPPGTVLGLEDARGFCLGLGVLDEVARDSVACLTSYGGEVRAVARLAPGSLRAHRVEPPAPDRPGEQWRLTEHRPDTPSRP